MSLLHHGRTNMVVVFAIVYGILIGLAVALLWIFGFIPTVRFAVPYAEAVSMLIFALTPIIALIATRTSNNLSATENEEHHSHFSLSGFVSTGMISSATFLIFVQIYVGTVLTRTLKILLSFVGAISFWVMFAAFIMMVIYIFRRRR